MGGKGQKRREKNYRESHGGSARLPPPPDPSSVDALPSKLLKLMALTEAAKKPPKSSAKGNDGVREMLHVEEKSTSKMSGVKRKTSDEKPVESSVPEKKSKKKRKKANDLRFESTEEFGGTSSKRKERRKQRLKDKKKKGKKASTQEAFDYPKHEQIKFGEVVDAPPKLGALPKARKMTLEASQERLRLKAVDAYRNRKGWASRPGIHLTPTITALPSL